MPAPSDAAGHRARLRGRVLEAPDSLGDYELVEYLLTLAIPRIDTKPIAKALLREFGGLGPLLAAPPDALKRVDQVGDSAAAALKVVQEAARRLLRETATARPVLASWQALLDYLRADMAHLGIERVRVLHLNGKNELIRDEAVSEGTIDSAPVHIREIVRRAMELGSAAIILVHNHPTGDPQPSRADIQLTRDIIDAGKRLGLAVHDHVIIGAKGHASLRALGLI